MGLIPTMYLAYLVSRCIVVKLRGQGLCMRAYLNELDTRFVGVYVI